MSTESDGTARPDPRLVPTLTEVVGRAGSRSAPAEPAAPVDLAPSPVSPAGATAPEPPLADQVLALLGSELEQRIGAAVARALHEQMLGLSGRIRAVVADEVREAVAQALQHGLPGADGSGNP